MLFSKKKIVVNIKFNKNSVFSDRIKNNKSNDCSKLFFSKDSNLTEK